MIRFEKRTENTNKGNKEISKVVDVVDNYDFTFHYEMYHSSATDNEVIEFTLGSYKGKFCINLNKGDVEESVDKFSKFKSKLNLLADYLTGGKTLTVTLVEEYYGVGEYSSFRLEVGTW